MRKRGQTFACAPSIRQRFISVRAIRCRTPRLCIRRKRIYNHSMLPETADRLNEINRVFYETFSQPFAATRRRIQPGVRRVLASLPPGGRWLDLGCGSGWLALEWARAGRSGLYCGVDFSSGLLDEARTVLAGESVPAGLEIRFMQIDLSAPDWPGRTGLSSDTWDGVLSFAVLHHIPSNERRLRLLRQIRDLLPPGGRFILSVWQYQNSPRLMARRLPWSAAGLREDAVEPGDTLLDWRAAPQESAGKIGLRYVHLFDRAELTRLAYDSRFTVTDEFESDGEGSRLGLYQTWLAV